MLWIRHDTIMATAILATWVAVANGGTGLTTVLEIGGLTRPVYVTHAPNDFERIFIVEQAGVIRIHTLGSGTSSIYLDIRSRVGDDFNEKGLLGLAIHPDYANNGFIYVNYTRSGTSNFDTRISRFQAIGPPMTATEADPDSESILLTYSQPFPNHNAGWMGFGPKDGYLYIASGDGGSGGDPGNRAQDITNQLLGKILRIDVDGGVPYAIPPTNPFVGISGDDEIWAYGLRNPWRCAFDTLTGDFYIGDVGQGLWEEVNVQSAASIGGENWGWRCREGAHDFDFSGNCGNETLIDPNHEYDHGGGRCSISGGEVYRGCAIPGLQGTYFFADFCSDQIWSFRGAGVAEFQERTAELEPAGPLSIGNPSSFGVDAYGEIYICDLGGGEVFKIVPAAGGPFSDCNENGKEDACDFADGTSLDANLDGIPDELGCDDDDVCTADACAPGLTCTNTANIYGDVDHNGTVNLTDLFCVLAGFSDLFVDCTFHDIDIHPCIGNDTINLFDLFGVIGAFSAEDPCCSP